MAKHEYPIDRPTEPGFYEAKLYPLVEGFVPLRVDAAGEWAELENDTDGDPYVYTIADREEYADTYGPFRKLTDDPTVAAPRATKLIGLAGRKRTGKNTAASYLVKEHGFEEAAFADPLRDLALSINPVVGWQKSCTNADELAPVLYSDALHHHGYEKAKELYPEFRRFLQRLGTEGIRETLGAKYGLRELLGDDVWIVLAKRRIQEADGPLVFTDVRFPNEADLIRRYSGEVVRITREAVLDRRDTHPSETSMDNYPVDSTIANDGERSQLNTALNKLVQYA